MDRPAAQQLEPLAANRPPGVRWTVRLLGRVEVQGPAGVVRHWHSRAVAELLARLALEPRRDHPREELATLLWPEADGESARRRLRQALSILRRQLDGDAVPDRPWLIADRQAIRLLPGVLDSDVARFLRAVQDTDAAAAAEAWRGEFMPGHYSEWVLDERARLLALRDRLLPSDAAPAEAATPKSLAPPPSSTAPAPVATADWTDGPATALPAYWTQAHGLADRVAEVHQRLRHCRMLSLVGPGGTGKTRLAVEAARGPALPGPAHFVSLAGVETAVALWETLASALAPGAAAMAPAQVIARCARMTGLLLLDNAEQLAPDAVDALASLLRQAPGLAVLVTTRRPLGLDGEALMPVAGLAVPPEAAEGAEAAEGVAGEEGDEAGDARLAGRFPGLALFLDRARAARADFHLTEGNRAAVLALVRRLDGLPLALELAASRLRALHPRELLQHLDAGNGSPMLDLLARPGGAGRRAHRHASMREVVSWSWHQLSPPAQRLLQLLSVLRAPVTPAMADALWRALGPADAGATGVLTELLDASLLQRADGDGAGPLQLMQPTREFAAEQVPAPLVLQVRAALRAWLTATFEARLPRDQAQLVPECAHLRELLTLAPGEAGDAAAAAALVDLAWAAMSSFNVAMPGKAILSGLEAALELLDKVAGEPVAAGAKSADAAGRLRRCRARLMRGHFSSDAEAVQQWVGPAVVLADDAAELAYAEGLLGMADCYRGASAADVLARLAAAEARARGAGALRVLALVLRSRAAVLVNACQDYAAAALAMEESLAIARSRGDEALVSLREVDLAAVLCGLGRWDAAVATLEACIERSRQQGLQTVWVSAQQQVGRVHLNRRRWPAAESALRVAETVHRTLGYTARHEVLAHLAEAWLMQGRDARDAALLMGHGVAAWQRAAVINPIQARELRRARRKLGLALGGARVAQGWLAQGAALAVADVDALVDRVHAGAPVPS